MNKKENQEKSIRSQVLEKQDLENRSILQNPKEDKKLTIDEELKDGFITPLWRRRINKFIHSLIPAHISKEKQVWLETPKQISKFIDNLKDPKSNMSEIEYICIPRTISDIYDLVDFFSLLEKKLPAYAKVIYCNYNWKWGFFFKLSATLGFSMKRPWGNFYRDDDLNCFLNMSGWENIKKMQRYILPFELKFIGAFFDNLIRLPLLRGFSLNTIFIARKKTESTQGDYSVSVLIPCKNEEENIEAVVKRTPVMGKLTELVFINDKSTDLTETEILKFQKEFPEKNIKLVQGKGIGKGEAVRDGVKEAGGDICMILDADLTVVPEDLTQFYEVMKSRRADFVKGTRLVYPQEKAAMKLPNTIGNITLSLVFSYILDQRVTDTLCGTHVFWRRDWPVFEETRKILNNIDLWGDHNLIFGAAKFGLKIGELPVRYFQRLKGLTKMTNRIKNGLIMLKVTWHALWKVKFAN